MNYIYWMLFDRRCSLLIHFFMCAPIAVRTQTPIYGRERRKKERIKISALAMNGKWAYLLGIRMGCCEQPRRRNRPTHAYYFDDSSDGNDRHMKYSDESVFDLCSAVASSLSIAFAFLVHYISHAIIFSSHLTNFPIGIFIILFPSEKFGSILIFIIYTFPRYVECIRRRDDAMLSRRHIHPNTRQTQQKSVWVNNNWLTDWLENPIWLGVFLQSFSMEWFRTTRIWKKD